MFLLWRVLGVLVFGLVLRRLLGLEGLRTYRLVFLHTSDVVNFLEILGCRLFFCFLDRPLLLVFLSVCLGCSIGFVVLWKWLRRLL